MKLMLSSQSTFVPWKSIMLYREQGSQHREGVVVVEHDAYVQSGVTKLGEGRMMDERSLRETVRAFSDALNAAPRVLHPRVLVDTPNLFAWWLPAGRRIQQFDIDWHKEAKGRDRLLNRKANLPHPALVFMTRVNGGRSATYLFALEQSQRPTGETKVFLAPFLNLNMDGWICWGSTPLPTTPIHECFAQVEEAFFLSTFSHLNQASVVKVGKKKSCYEFFADLCDNPPEAFPVEVMLPMGTLNDVIAKIAGGQ